MRHEPQPSSAPSGSIRSPGQDPDPEAFLRVRDLHKHFRLHAVDREVHALRGVDLDVRRGEHVALAGTSGAGKSSLLKCVWRTYVPSSGTVTLAVDDGPLELTWLDDRAMTIARRRHMGYVSQFLRAEPRRGVLDIVARAAVARGMAADVARDAAAVVLRRVNVDEALWSTYPTLLSGGEKQRVNLAVGTIQPPELLLLDEPVSALDPANRAAVLAQIAGLRDRGVAVLSVFHDLDAMVRLADRVVVMANGQVVDDGDPEPVLARNLAVAS
ncbi:MAG: ATP-binding cassette domain-containing protein [Actinomycetota bacterium]|nr:ATP-binding cassette domain-containing protein [Actinomycetota bacterium]